MASASKKVLIVDDDQDLVRLLARKLSQAGVETLAAYDAIQAVQMAHREAPGLILLDIKLPAGGGMGALVHIKRSLRTESIPIIAMSADESADVARDPGKHGVEAFMRKPLDFETLIERGLTIIGMKNPPAGTPCGCGEGGRPS
jgi:CheY-like chemotaxis protein